MVEGLCEAGQLSSRQVYPGTVRAGAFADCWVADQMVVHVVQTLRNRGTVVRRIIIQWPGRQKTAKFPRVGVRHLGVGLTIAETCFPGMRDDSRVHAEAAHSRCIHRQAASCKLLVNQCSSGSLPVRLRCRLECGG